ncbi:hypothetical protein [Microvirga calopogonii]|uniref:hypothetical protein n=1 Tax=Microvirga calopogonii TaxID=2078013 RepID=UPI000E0D7521|nr:hypothetical protein [Microvirga calopogonii]
MTAQDPALALAKRKARYGHRDWLFWKDRNGASHCARRSAETVKAAMLAAGTSGKWFIVQASTGVLVKGFWRLGINLLKNAKYGI